MKIVICGLGYVGVTTAACLARDGHLVVGIDIDPDKVAQVAAGLAPVSEPGVAGLLAAAHAAGRIAAETALGDHLDDADLVMVCVGTPSLLSGSLDTAQVTAVAAELGAASRAAGRRAPPPPAGVPQHPAARRHGRRGAAGAGRSGGFAARGILRGGL